MPTCSSSSLTHPGRSTSSNEDFRCADDARRLYVVSDGVGSCRKAALASRVAVETVCQALEAAKEADVRKRLSWAAREANRRVQEEGSKISEVMAATLTVLQLAGEDFHVVHIGDSRAYLLRQGRLQQITRDHSVAFEQYWVGAITKDDLRTHPNQNVLTRTLGTHDYIVPDFTDGRIEPRDRFLLCSDGLTKELPDERIAEILSREPQPLSACRRLVDAANDAGGRDNITVVVVDVA